jgi:non-ribosomal peptide synthetase component F
MNDSLSSLISRTPAADETAAGTGTNDRPAALSAMQQSLLLAQKNNPLCSAHNEGIAVELDAATDLDRLYQALVSLMKSNSQLATVYDYTGGIPVGKLLPPVPDFTVEDCSSSGRTELEKIINAAYNTAFDLTKSCMRVRIYKTASGTYLMLAVFHPVACDEWSRRQLWNQLTGYYTENAAALPMPGHSYAGFVENEQAYLAGAEAAAAKNYWKKTLGSKVKNINTTFRSNGILPVNTSSQLKVTVSRNTIAAIRAHTGNDTGFFDILLSAYQVALTQLRKQQDLVIGTPFFSRPAQYRNVCGNFMRNLAVTTPVNYELTFAEHLRNNQALIKESKKHAAYPFAGIEAIAGKQNNSTGYFNYFFSFRNRRPGIVPLQNKQGEGSKILSYKVLDILKKTDPAYLLHLEVLNQEPLLNMIFHYNAATIIEKDIHQVASRFTALLNMIAANPGKTIGELLPAGPDRANWVKSSISRPLRSYETGRGYSVLFAAQAKRCGNAIAVSDLTGRWSYAELDAHAGTIAVNIAAYFRNAGKNEGNKKVIAVAIEKCRELAAFAIGTWRAGYVYMPVDPLLPSAIIQQMLEEAGAGLFITDSMIPDLAVSQVLASHFFKKCKKNGELHPESAGQWMDGYCILYTTGPAGTISGTLISPQQLLNDSYAAIEMLQLDETSKVAQTASQNCAASVWQKFATLLGGGEVRFYTESEMLDADRHVLQLDEGDITVIPVTARLLAGFAEAVISKRPSFATLKYIVSTGQEQTESQLFQWLRQYTHVRLANWYGMADNNKKVKPGNSSISPHVPVCRALTNMQVYMVDRHGRLCTHNTAHETGLQAVAGCGDTPVMVPFSAHTARGLHDHISNTAAFIATNQSITVDELADELAKEAGNGRFRKSFVAYSKEDLLLQLTEYLADEQEEGEIATPAGLVFIFPGGNTPPGGTVDMWCQADAYFKERYYHYVKQITLGMERTAPSIERFVFQLAYYDFLMHHGIEASRITGIESGQLIAAVTAGSITLKEATAQIDFEHTRLLTVNQMDEIIAKLIAGNALPGKTIFIDMSLGSWVAWELEKNPSCGSRYLVFRGKAPSPADTIAMLKSLLYDNGAANPERFFECMKEQELPLKTAITRVKYSKEIKNGNDDFNDAAGQITQA